MEQGDRVVRVGGEDEDPQVALQIDPPRGESPAGQVLQVGSDLGRYRCQLPGDKSAKARLCRPQVADARSELLVDLAQRLPELRVGRRSQLSDTGQGDAGFGERPDFDQVDGVAGVVSPVPGRITVGLGEQPLVVIDADGLDRYSDIRGQLPDGDHPAIVALDLSPGAGSHHGVMENTNIDRETLRELADEGNESALDRLADLVDAAGDLDELSELLDEGSLRAGFLLTRRAVAAGDLRELQRISDAGYDEAGSELERLLKASADEYRD